MGADIDLSNTSVFFDFDGTISTKDVGVYLLERLAAPTWRDIDDAYDTGAIGSRECMEREWACIPGEVGAEQRRAVAAEVPLDGSFGPLVDGLRARGAEVVVVSDGFGFYVRERTAPFGVAVITNDVDFAANTMRFPTANESCEPCGECGTCKRLVIAEAAQRGRATVFIGDGTSDRHAARVADTLFAKAALAAWCGAEGIAYTPFETLADVSAVLLPN